MKHNGNKNISEGSYQEIAMKNTLLSVCSLLFLISLGCNNKSALMLFQDTVYLNDYIVLAEVTGVDESDKSVNVRIIEYIKGQNEAPDLSFYCASSMFDSCFVKNDLIASKKYILFLYQDKGKYYLSGGSYGCYLVNDDNRVYFEGSFISTNEFVKKIKESQKPIYYK